VTLQKYFSHPSLVIYFSATQPMKLELQIVILANHLDQSLCLANQKQGAAVTSYLLHSSLQQLHTFAAPFTHQPQQAN
jgi:hypothetical protein